MSVYQAAVGVQVRAAFSHVPGLTLQSFDPSFWENGSAVAAGDLGANLVEVEAGYYELVFTPREVGLVSAWLSNGVFQEIVVFQVSPGVEVAEGDLQLTVKDGAGNPHDGVTVRVFSGTRLVIRSVTPSSGEVTVGLPVGDYSVRYSKPGVEFGGAQSVTVTANDEVTPLLDAVYPSEATVGDRVLLRGAWFGDDATFDGVVSVAVTSGDDLMLVAVPAGLTNVAVQVRVRKPDPTNPGQYLSSNAVTLMRT